MNKNQKLVQQQFLNNEKEVIRRLRLTYGQALKDVDENIKNLDMDINGVQATIDMFDNMGGSPDDKAKLQSMLQSKIYQKQYQEAIHGQIDDVMKKLHKNAYATIDEYVNDCYSEAFIGAAFDLHGQGIPLIMPIDQESVVRAVQLDSKINKGLYFHLGENVNGLKQTIANEVSRGLVNGSTYAQIAQQISFKMVGTYQNPGGAMAYAMRIARTEGHRIQCQAGMDACYKAKDMGADVVKQWDSTLDGDTRESHKRVDGEIRELDEPFSNGLDFPGDPSGVAEEVIHCRCALLERARWALDDDELETLKQRAEFYGLDKSENFEDFKKKYLKAASVMKQAQDIKISNKLTTNGYSVNRGLVNSKTYHDKFDSLPLNKTVQQSAYYESKVILEHRDGTAFEDVTVIDSKTGKFIVNNNTYEQPFKSAMTKEQYSKVTSHKGNVVIIHNHAEGTRLSKADIFTAFATENADASIAIGHNGSVHCIYDINRKINIDKIYNSVYNDVLEEYGNKELATIKATDALYMSGAFKYLVL